MKKKVGADECDAPFALTFFLTTLVTISLTVLFHFLRFCYCWKGLSRL